MLNKNLEHLSIIFPRIPVQKNDDYWERSKTLPIEEEGEWGLFFIATPDVVVYVDQFKSEEAAEQAAEKKEQENIQRGLHLGHYLVRKIIDIRVTELV